MTDRYQQQWETLGHEDPFWAVLSDPTKKGGRWDREDFFRTGSAEIEQLLLRCSQRGISLDFNAALDYGCGVGRLSQALAARFRSVVAVDISNTMLAVARRENAAFGNIDFLHTRGDNLVEVADRSIDLLYSNIVLQHSPPRTQQGLIQEFCRVLRPGGALVFQTPSQPDIHKLRGLVHLLVGNRVLNLARRLRYGQAGVMEMHVLKKEKVLALLNDGGMAVVDVVADESAGPAFVSFMYFSVRR